jgi:CDP-glucose 4,6-dehydratase
LGEPKASLGTDRIRAAVRRSWSERRVLVTGATGIVGSWLCAELLRRDAYVTAFVLDEDPRSEFFRNATAARCSIVRGNLSRYDDCARAINASESEVVFHLGAQTLVGAAVRDPLETFESNVRGTYNLLEASRRFKDLVKAIVVASSDKAYGDASGVPYVEDMPLSGRHPYDVSKSCADLIATTYAHTYGLPVTIARCGNIYGGGDLNWSRIVPGTIRSLLRGSRPVLRSDGTLVRDYIYVRDVVCAYLLVADALEDPAFAGQAYNFSPESRVTVLEIVERIAAVMGAPCDPVILNEVRFEIPEQTLDAGKARRTLGWSSSWTLEAGLAETVEWYRRHLGDPRTPPAAWMADALR